LIILFPLMSTGVSVRVFASLSIISARPA
jgi:hypothetical protein